jgi:hypothetical protein
MSCMNLNFSCFASFSQIKSTKKFNEEEHKHKWVYDGYGGGRNGEYVHNCACGASDWFASPIR